MMDEFAVILYTLFTTTIIAATPLIFAALGGAFSERSGVVNIALEGIMTIGAFFAAMTSFYLAPLFTQWFAQSGLSEEGIASWATSLAPVGGLLAAMIVGALFGALLAFVSIRFRANQVMVGVAINILAVSLVTFLLRAIMNEQGQTPPVASFPTIAGDFNILNFLALAMIPVAWFIIYKTPGGLRIRSVGEHPRAADTLGVSVSKVRYWSVIVSGILAGIGGASLSIAMVSAYREGMVAGKGFIALAALIFGRWNPVGAGLACLFFGLADGFQVVASMQSWKVPQEVFFMLPYLLTILAVSFVGRSAAPAADGLPYEKK
jgi:general nucleoside transport system permease protein